MPNAQSWNIREFDKKVYFLKAKIVYVIDKADLIPDSTKVNTFFVRIRIGKDSTILNGSFYKTINGNIRIPIITADQTSIPEFRYDMNKISFEWTTHISRKNSQPNIAINLMVLTRHGQNGKDFHMASILKRNIITCLTVIIPSG